MKTYKETMKNLNKKYGKGNIIEVGMNYVSIGVRELQYAIKTDRGISYYNYVNVKY